MVNKNHYLFDLISGWTWACSRSSSPGLGRSITFLSMSRLTIGTVKLNARPCCHSLRILPLAWWRSTSEKHVPDSRHSRDATAQPNSRPGHTTVTNAERKGSRRLAQLQVEEFREVLSQIQVHMGAIRRGLSCCVYTSYVPAYLLLSEIQEAMHRLYLVKRHDPQNSSKPRRLCYSSRFFVSLFLKSLKFIELNQWIC